MRTISIFIISLFISISSVFGMEFSGAQFNQYTPIKEQVSGQIYREIYELARIIGFLHVVEVSLDRFWVLHDEEVRVLMDLLVHVAEDQWHYTSAIQPGVIGGKAQPDLGFCLSPTYVCVKMELLSRAFLDGATEGVNQAVEKFNAAGTKKYLDDDYYIVYPITGQTFDSRSVIVKMLEEEYRKLVYEYIELWFAKRGELLDILNLFKDPIYSPRYVA